MEYPAGYVDAGENPEQAARRELLEETGYAAAKLSPLAKLSDNPTKQVGTLHVFLAEDVSWVQDQHLDADGTEEIEVLTLAPSEVWQMIQDGEIWVSGTVAATLLAFDKLKLWPKDGVFDCG